MPRKSRRTRSAKKGLVTWQRVIIVVAPVLVLFFLLTNGSGGKDVLGLSESNLLRLGRGENTSDKPKPTPKPSCNRVTSFSANTICESNSSERSNNAFSVYSYTCEDGTSGAVEQTQLEGRCVPIGKAYELARKACYRKCITPKPTHPPKPTEVESE